MQEDNEKNRYAYFSIGKEIKSDKIYHIEKGGRGAGKTHIQLERTRNFIKKELTETIALEDRKLTRMELEALLMVLTKHTDMKLYELQALHNHIQYIIHH